MAARLKMKEGEEILQAKLIEVCPEDQHAIVRTLPRYYKKLWQKMVGIYVRSFNGADCFEKFQEIQAKLHELGIGDSFARLTGLEDAGQELTQVDRNNYGGLEGANRAPGFWSIRNRF